MKLKSQKGFTLIETLVAIAIFAFAITGLISISASGVFNTNFVKNKFTASYLALEGAELVHNIRDSASIQGIIWDGIFLNTDFLKNCSNGDACYIDATTPGAALIVNKCPAPDACPLMNYRKSTAQFNYDTLDGDNVESIFKRTITVTGGFGATPEVKVISKVEWNQGADPHSVTFTYDLLNWTGP